jgi:cell division topological specificity factor
MISTLLDRFFQRTNVPSGTKVKQRLKFILAHDRAAIEPQVFDNMRHEIMRVVSKYVELDENALDIRLESDKRMTALIANLPILTIREELPDLVSLFDQADPEPKSEPQIDLIALEMDQSAEAALDALSVKENPQTSPSTATTSAPAPEIIPETIPENAVAIAEHNIEVTNKIRLAANKSQSEQDERVIEEISDFSPMKTINTASTLEVTVPEVLGVDQNAQDIAVDMEDPEGCQVEAIADQEPSDQLELSLDIIPPATDSQI